MQERKVHGFFHGFKDPLRPNSCVAGETYMKGLKGQEVQKGLRMELCCIGEPRILEMPRL